MLPCPALLVSRSKTPWEMAGADELWKEEVEIRVQPFPGLSQTVSGATGTFTLPAALAVTHGSETPVTAQLPRRGGGEELGRPFSCDSSCKPQVIQPQPKPAPASAGERSSSTNTLWGHLLTLRQELARVKAWGSARAGTTFPAVPQPRQHPAGHGDGGFSRLRAGSPPDPTATLPEYFHWQKEVILASPPRNSGLGLLLMEGKQGPNAGLGWAPLLAATAHSQGMLGGSQGTRPISRAAGLEGG